MPGRAARWRVRPGCVFFMTIRVADSLASQYSRLPTLEEGSPVDPERLRRIHRLPGRFEHGPVLRHRREHPHEDEIFANWFSNDQSHPLVVLKGADPVGFALVTRPRIPAAGEPAADYRMSEFFVRKQYRRVGMGRDAATLIFDRFAGNWEIVEYLRNPGAVAFWRRVLAVYCAGRLSPSARVMARCSSVSRADRPRSAEQASSPPTRSLFARRPRLNSSRSASSMAGFGRFLGCCGPQFRRGRLVVDGM